MSFISRLTEKFSWYINTPYFSANFQENCIQIQKGENFAIFFVKYFFSTYQKRKFKAQTYEIYSNLLDFDSMLIYQNKSFLTEFKTYYSLELNSGFKQSENPKIIQDCLQ